MDRLDTLPPEERVLCLAARSRRSHADEERLAAAIHAGLDWDRLWALGHLHEVVAVLAPSLTRAVAHGAPVPEPWLAHATRRRHVTLQSNARLAETLLPTLDALDVAGVPVIPVKGLALTERLYGDLASRPCADIDILVRASDLSPARDVLRELGFYQRVKHGYKALVHQFHDPAWGRGGTADHVRLELHWALWADSTRRLGVDGLWQRALPGTLLGRDILQLSLEDTLLHLAIHRTRSALRLRWLVDVAELVRRHGADLDWTAYIERAGAAGGRTASWTVLRLADELLGAPVPATVMEALAVGGPKRAVLERTCGVTAMFREVNGDMRQQPHMWLRTFEEDGPGRIAGALRRSALRPVREALHDAGIVTVRQRMA